MPCGRCAQIIMGRMETLLIDRREQHKAKEKTQPKKQPKRTFFLHEEALCVQVLHKSP